MTDKTLTPCKVKPGKSYFLNDEDIVNPHQETLVPGIDLSKPVKVVNQYPAEEENGQKVWSVIYHTKHRKSPEHGFVWDHRFDREATEDTKRKVVQIAADSGRCFALCDDGTLWTRHSTSICGMWIKLSDVPQD